MKFDRYDLISRIFPAVICVTPILTFSWFFLGPEIVNFFQSVYSIKWLSGISIPLVFIFLLAQINRVISKELFEKRYFEDELEMPTTNFLLHTDGHYSETYKEKVYDKIKKDFGLTLSTQKEEIADISDARKKISEAIGQIRKKVGNGTLLQQHKIEYGFFRNLIGGSLLASVFSLVNIIFFLWVSPNELPLKISILTSCLFLVPVLFRKKIILNMGVAYAKVLLQEYMSIK